MSTAKCVALRWRWLPPHPPPQGKRLRSFLIRTVSTVVLIAFFVVFVYSGHVPLMFMVLGIQVGATRGATCPCRHTTHATVYHGEGALQPGAGDPPPRPRLSLVKEEASRAAILCSAAVVLV